VFKEHLGLVLERADTTMQHAKAPGLIHSYVDIATSCNRTASCPADVVKEHLGLVLEPEDKIGCYQQHICRH
jgi:hypothetical protein